MKAVVADLKVIYRAISIEQAEEALLCLVKNGIKNIQPLAVHGIKTGVIL